MKPSEIDEGVKVWMAHILKAIFINDKTEYDYFGHLQERMKGKTTKSSNRFGEEPLRGKRWNTPSEIAFDALKDLGYDHPNDVTEGKEEKKNGLKND